MSWNYWEEADKRWFLIKSLVSTFHPSLRPNIILGLPITNGLAEDISKEVREEVKREENGDVVVAAEKALKERDGATFQKIMNEVWWWIPESSWVHELPGFYTLCDLCSEEYPENG